MSLGLDFFLKTDVHNFEYKYEEGLFTCHEDH